MLGLATLKSWRTFRGSAVFLAALAVGPSGFTASAAPRARPASAELQLSPGGFEKGLGAASSARILTDTAGRVGAAWVARRRDTTPDYTVRFRWFDEYLSPLTDDYRLNLQPHQLDSGDVDPTVALTPQDEVLVGFTTSGLELPDDDDQNVFLRRTAFPTDLVGEELYVNSTRRWSQELPSVAASQSGVWVVVWQNSELGPFDETVRYQRFDDGVPAGSETAIRNVAITHRGQIISSQSGGFYLTWDGRETGGTDSVYLARLSEDGELGAPVVVGAGQTVQTRPQLAELADGSLLLVWRGEKSESADAGVYVQAFTSALVPAGEIVRVWSDLAPTQRRNKGPRIAASPSEMHALVAWEEGDRGEDGERVRLQVVAADGTSVGDPFDPAQSAMGRQLEPDLAYLTADRVVVTWTRQPDRSDLNSLAIAGRLFDVGMLSPLCGDATNDGFLTATDALAALRAAVGLFGCISCLCDVDGSTTQTAVDALAILRSTVGIAVEFRCPSC